MKTNFEFLFSHYHAVAEILNLNAFNEDDLYKTLDWLYEHKEKIENQLFKERGHGSFFYLYDVTSSYLEGKMSCLKDRLAEGGCL